MRKSLSRLTAAFSAACLVLAVTSSASAYTITAQGALTTDSTVSTSIDLAGTLSATGSGFSKSGTKVSPFVVTGVASDPGATPPGGASAPISLDSGVVVVNSTASSTAPNPAGADWTLTDPNLKTLSDVQNLDVDLLTGATGSFAINTLHVYTNSVNFLLKDIDINLGGTLSAMSFTQTGAAALAPTGVGTGTYSIDGDISATVSGLLASILFGAVEIPVDDQVISSPFALTGSYTVTAIPGGRHIALDGSVNLAVPVSVVTALVTSLATPALTISTTVDLLASITVAVGYHLETNVVPEPGSFILLGIGLAALVPVLRLRRKS